MINWYIILFGFLFFFNIPNISFSKDITFRVFYTDKGPAKFEKGSDLYRETLSILSERAVKRRLKVLDEDNIISIEDAPVYKIYSDSIQTFGCNFVHNLRWKNYSVFRCDSADFDNIKEQIKGYDFVKFVQLTGSKISELQSAPAGNRKRKFSKRELYTEGTDFQCSGFNYGESYLQNDLMKATELHKLGITGDSVLIGFLDSGFRWKTHNSMKDACVIAEYDFIQMDSNTANEKDDVINQDGHGTLVFSSVSGYLPGELIGISPSSSFILCKTESIPDEIRLEEDNYAAAIEWLEAMGADISSSSLAYKTFDEPDDDYDFEELNGKTSITAQVINDAVRRGMICLTAAGNTGPEPSTLLTPSDADSVLGIGAVNISNGEIVPARFSARGPRGDYEIKPDISTLGVQVVCAGTEDSIKIIKANGTSLSTPLTAGGSALLLSIFPELKPWEIRNLLYVTSSEYPNKNNDIGYGNIDIWSAAKSYGIIISPPAIYTIKNFKRILFNIVSDEAINLKPRLKLIVSSFEYEFELIKITGEYAYVADIPLSLLNSGEIAASLTVKTPSSIRQYPYDGSYFRFGNDTEHIPCGMPETVLSKFETEKKLFVYPSIVKKLYENIRINYELLSRSSLTIEIYSSDGKLLTSDFIPDRPAGIIDHSILISNFAQGLYFAVVKTDKHIEAEKFMIIK